MHIKGIEDLISGAPATDTLAIKVPQLKIHRLSGVSHFSPREAPEFILEKLNSPQHELIWLVVIHGAFKQPLISNLEKC